MRDAWLVEQEKSMEEGGKKSGVKMAKGWRDSFERELKGQPPRLIDEKFQKSLDDLFKRMGTSNSMKWFGEFDRVIGGSGQWGRIVGEFDRWGNTSSERFRTSFWKDTSNLFKPGSWAGAFSKGLTEDGKKLGVDFSRGWIKGFMSIFDNPVTIGLGIPVIGSLIAEALAGIGGLGGATLGLAGIGAGIVGQLKDPRIKSAAKQAWADIQSSLTSSSVGFVGPLEESLNRYDQFVTRSTARFSEVYKPLAAVLVPLETGFERFTDKVLPGLIDGSNRAAPLLRTFAKELPEMGHAIGDFLEKLTSSERGNREGLIAIIDLVDTLIRFLGNLVQVGSHAFAGLVDIGHYMSYFTDDTMGALLRLEGKIPVIGTPFDWLGKKISSARDEINKLFYSKDGFGGVGSVADAATHAIGKINTALKEQVDEIDKVTKRWDDWAHVSMSLDTANLTLHQDMTALTDSIAQNGKQWNLNTKEGQANYGALTTVMQGALDMRDAEVKAGHSMDEANDHLRTNLDWLFKQAQNAGLDAGSIQDLKNQVYYLNDSLNSINGKSVYFKVSGIYANANQFYTGDPANFHGSLEHGGFVPQATAAQGIVVGPRRPGTMVLMGEPGTRGEVAIPQAGISRARAAALGATALAPYGMAPGPIGGGASVVHVQVTAPVYLNGRQVADASFEDFVTVAQERKNRRGATGLA